MSVRIEKEFFRGREEVLQDLAKTGFWPTTLVSEASPELPLHWHDVEVHTYVLEGETYLVDGGSGEKLPVRAGDKISIAPGVVHAEGVVEARVVYIVALPEASNLEPLYRMHDPKDAD